MLTDEVGGNGDALKAGKRYELEDASADHWLKRGKAELAGEEEESDDIKPPSFGLKVDEIKDALAAKGIEIPEGVTLKADLAALLDAAE